MLALYEAALVAGDAPLRLALPGGAGVVMDVPRWCARADASDRALLDRCAGPVLDVGCGPGRLVAALSLRGVRALGVDVAPAAVALARRAGGRVLQRSVFDPLPLEGGWGEVLLVDGNVGIGGDPTALLRRVAVLLAPGGRLLAEVERRDVDEVFLARLEDSGGRCSEPFPWARMGARALRRRGVVAGLGFVEEWSGGGRRFVVLARGAA